MATSLFDNVSGLLMVRTGMAVLLVFCLPGYAITFALFPRHRFGLVERLLLVISASVSVAIVGGLILNLLPAGLQVSSWLVLLSGVTLVAGSVAWVRSPNRQLAASFKLSRLPTYLHALAAGVGFTVGQTLLIGLAALVIGLTWSIAHTPAPVQGLQGYTLLWLLPAEANQPPAVRLGIRSSEFTPTTYKLQLTANQQLVHEWPVIALKPNTEWDGRFALTPQQLNNTTIEANLYRLDQPATIYRQVVLRPNQLERK